MSRLTENQELGKPRVQRPFVRTDSIKAIMERMYELRALKAEKRKKEKQKQLRESFDAVALLENLDETTD